MLLAFGALHYRAEHLRLEVDHLRREEQASGGELFSLSVIDRLIETAEERRAVLAERLPYGTPDDLAAVGFAYLFDEYERKLREKGHRLNPALDTSSIPGLRRQLQYVCVVGPPPIDPRHPIPQLTADPDDDPIVYGALLADTEVLVSDDKHIVGSGERHYQHEDHSLVALRFDLFCDAYLDAVELDDIDGSWLRLAFS